jgi:hypothetical protein
MTFLLREWRRLIETYAKSQMPEFAKNKATVHSQLNYSKSCAITKCSWVFHYREKKNAASLVLSLVAVEQLNTKHHVTFLLVLVSLS